MKTEITDDMPQQETWAWLREMLDALGDKVLKLYCLDVEEVRKTRAAVYNWAARYSDKQVTTSTKRIEGRIILYVRATDRMKKNG